MGYFNYFIKCVIRKFVNMIFKPKMFLALLIIIGLLFAMQISSKAEWTETQKAELFTKIDSLSLELQKQYELIRGVGGNVADIEAGLNNIYDELDLIYRYINELEKYTYEINNKMDTLITDMENLNTQILNIYNSLEENQQELLTELEKDNQAVLEELNMIRESINGTDEELDSYSELPIIINDSKNMFLKLIQIDYEPKYSYNIKVYYNNPYSSDYQTSVYYDDNIPPDGFNYREYSDKFHVIGKVPSGVTDFVINYQVPSSNPKYVGFIWGNDIAKIEVYRSIKGIVESLNDSNSLQQQQNQLQQESNQLQQEQNDILTNDNVETDGLEFATDDTVNPTDDGFNTLFTSIYNAFCNTSSKPLTVTLPYVNQTFTIQPNLVSNAMQKMRFRCCSKFN